MKERIRTFVQRVRLFKNWHHFVYPFNRARYNVVAKLRNGAKFILRDIRSDDYSTLLSIAGEDSYRFSAIHDPRVILDVGAHIGFFSILAARRFREAQIIAVEPNRENYQALLQNIALNGLTNISALNVAVAGDYGKVSFFTSAHTVAHSLFSNFDGISLGKEEVDSVPLSHFKNVDVLKFDAEGAEYTIEEFPKVAYLAIELHKIEGQDMQKLIESIRNTFHVIRYEAGKTGHINIIGISK